MKIWMFVFNNCAHDARVLKEAGTLAGAGHDVKIAALAGEGLSRIEERDGFRILRVPVLLPGVRLDSVDSGHARAGGSRDSAGARLRAGNLFRRPLGLFYDWAKSRPPGRLRRLIQAAYRSYSYFQYARQAKRLVRQEPGDVYHCHDLNTLSVGYTARRRHGGKLVYDAHELTGELAYISWLERLGWRMLERFLIRRVDAVITTGSYRSAYLVSRYHIEPPIVLLNCPPLSRDVGPDRALREKLGVTDDTVPIILYQGGFIAGRGLEKLVLAADHLATGILVLMGWGAQEQELRDLVKRRGLEGRLCFTEPVAPAELVRYCKSASVGVVIYRNTGLNNYYATPNKLYEYIHAGVPVVSSDFPALNEIVEGYELGCTFDPEDPQSIAAAINLVLEDGERHDTMRRNALEAAKVFNWENESRKLLEVYERLRE